MENKNSRICSRAQMLDAPPSSQAAYFKTLNTQATKVIINEAFIDMH